MEGDGISIEVAELDRLRRTDPDLVILDVRAPQEIELCSIEHSLEIPLSELPDRINEIPCDRPLAVLCHHGVRSLQATMWLRGRGYDRAMNVAGGIDAWAAVIDPTMRRY